MEILEIINNNPSIGYRNIAKQLNINNSAIQKHLNNLKKKGLIVREGKTKETKVMILQEKRTEKVNKNQQFK